MHVNVWIHDFEAMDRYLLDQPSRGGLPSGRPFAADPAGSLGRGAELTGAPGPSDPLGSLAEEQQRRAEKEAQAADEAQRFFARGESAEAAGKPAVARIYYRMAARRATGPLKATLTAKLEAISRAETGDAVVDAAR
jgi:hypothetical protein